MRSFAQRAEFATVTGPIGLIVGANKNLALQFVGAAGGGSWRLSGSPQPDHMDVDWFQATLVGEATCAPVLGAHVFIGRLTGLQSGDAVQWLRTYPIGTNGELWVRAPGPFVTEYGLAVYVDEIVTSANYVILAQGGVN